jgi:hypothetical protein
VKISISLDKETTMLYTAIMNEEECTNVSAFFQKLVKEYANSQGYELIPASIVKREKHD